jgi:hypothetical protein
VEEVAAPGRNFRKANAKTHRLNTFPGGKVAPKATDEGYAVFAKEKISKWRYFG